MEVLRKYLPGDNFNDDKASFHQLLPNRIMAKKTFNFKGCRKHLNHEFPFCSAVVPTTQEC